MRSLTVVALTALVATSNPSIVSAGELLDENGGTPSGSLQGAVELMKQHPISSLVHKESRCIVLVPRKSKDSGVALCRTPDGLWSYPSFVTVKTEVREPLLIQLLDRSLAEVLKEGDVSFGDEDKAKVAINDLEGDSWKVADPGETTITADHAEQVKVYGEGAEYRSLLSKAGEEGEDELISELLSLLAKKPA